MPKWKKVGQSVCHVLQLSVRQLARVSLVTEQSSKRRLRAIDVLGSLIAIMM